MSRQASVEQQIFRLLANKHGPYLKMGLDILLVSFSPDQLQDWWGSALRLHSLAMQSMLKHQTEAWHSLEILPVSLKETCKTPPSPPESIIVSTAMLKTPKVESLSWQLDFLSNWHLMNSDSSDSALLRIKKNKKKRTIKAETRKPSNTLGLCAWHIDWELVTRMSQSYLPISMDLPL